MMEMKRSAFSLPKDYVTLQQLKERKEQEQKKREKEEEEKEIEEQKVKEEQEKKQKEEEERTKLQVLRKSQQVKIITGVSSDRRPYRRNFQKFTGKYVRKEKNDHHQVLERQEGKIVVAVEAEILDPDENLDEMKEEKKKKKKKWGKNRNKKLKAEETSIGNLEKLPPLENNPEEIMHKKIAGKMNAQNEIRRLDKRPPSESVEVSMNPMVEIGDRNNLPTLEINPEEKMHEKVPSKKMNTRNRFQRWEKRPTSKQVKVPIYQTVEIELKTEDIEKSPPSEVNPAEVMHEKTAEKMKTRNGFQRREKKASSKQAEVPLNPTVEIEQKNEDIKKSPPLEVNPGEIIPEKTTEKKTTQNGFRRRGKKPPSKQDEVLTNPTVDIEQKIGDLTMDDDKKKSTTRVFPRRKDFRKFGYERKRMEASVMWVRKDEKETDEISGELSDRRSC